MTHKRKPSSREKPPRWYRGLDIPLRVIRRFARQVAEQFRPEKIILFGSRAYGQPHVDSDVDIMVVMPARNQLDQAVRIELSCDPPFPLDILVRTPKNWQRGLDEGESFLREVAEKGKVLYEKETREWVRKAEADYRVAKKLWKGSEPFHDVVCFHCQQCAEKYLKGLMEELGLTIPYTHILKDLLAQLQRHHPSLKSFRRGFTFLTRFAVAFRYPGENATKRQAAASMRWVEKVRLATRALLGL